MCRDGKLKHLLLYVLYVVIVALGDTETRQLRSHNTCMERIENESSNINVKENQDYCREMSCAVLYRAVQ